MNLTLIFSTSTKSGVGAKTPSSCGFLCRTSCRFSLSCFHEPSATWKCLSMASTWPFRGFRMHLCMAFSSTTSAKESAATVTIVWRKKKRKVCFLEMHTCNSVQWLSGRHVPTAQPINQNLAPHHLHSRLPSWLSKKIRLRGGRPGFDPWVGRIPWRRKWQPTPVFLPGEFHGQRSLEGYSPWGCRESDTTERLSTAHTRSHTKFSFFFSKEPRRVNLP